MKYARGQSLVEYLIALLAIMLVVLLLGRIVLEFKQTALHKISLELSAQGHRNQTLAGPCLIMNKDPNIFYDKDVARYRNKKNGRFVALRC